MKYCECVTLGSRGRKLGCSKGERGKGQSQNDGAISKVEEEEEKEATSSLHL